MRTIQIDFSEAQLVFRIDENDWCQAELHTSQEQFKLGADKWSILKEKFANALTNLSNSNEPEWMLTLMEEHCSLYRQNIDGKNSFFWQDAQARQFWTSGLIGPLNEETLQIT